jgi:hypothetical protein
MDWKKILDEMKAKMQVVLAKAKAENRAFSAEEQAEFDGYAAKAEEATSMIKAEAAAVVSHVAHQPSEDAQAAATKKVMAMQKSLRATAKALSYTDETVIVALLDEVMSGTKTEAQAKDEIIAKHQEGMQSAGGTRINVGADGTDKYRAAASIVLAHSAGIPLSKEESAEIPKTGMQGMTLQGFCRDYLVRNNVSRAHAMNGEELFRAMCNRPRNAIAQGSDDFASILENTMNKSLTAGWNEVPTTWQTLCGRETVNDFRNLNMISISLFSDMEEIPEGSGPTYGRLADKKETIAVKTYGKAWSLSRQAIINDDLGAFVQGPRLMARSARLKIERMWIDLLTSASFAGPTMTETSRAFFNTTDGNYLDAAGAAPSVTTIGAGSLAMQTRSCLGPNDKKTSATPTGATPAYIFVPTAIEVPTMQVVRSISDPASTTGAGNVYNPYNGLGFVSSALLNAKSTKRWYLFADPRMYPAFVVAFLRGNETPVARMREGGVGEPLGIVYDTYFDAAVGAKDWRYGYQSKGEA